MAGEVIAGVETALTGAIAWWREAGVDHAYADAPTVWLAEPEVEDEKPAPAPLAAAQPLVPARPLVRIGGDPEGWPQELSAFHAWWLAEPSLDDGRVAGRVAPRGNRGAEVMLLVEQPEAEDRDELLSGPHGSLLNAMLAAMGVTPENAYLAAALTRHTPMPDWAALHEAGLGEVIAHHIRLAAPRRIIAFGSTIPALLGNHLTQSGKNLHGFNHEGGTIPLLQTRPPEALSRGKAKAALWQQWLDWTGA